jgi:hypothetical protein
MNAQAWRYLGIGGLIAVVVLEACKSGEGPTTPTMPSRGATLSGTAAQGNPIANAAVTVKDRNGASRTGTTGATGKYSVDVSGLTAPFLVRVDPSGGASLYSVAAALGVANVHPYSDLSISLWYQVQGKTITTAFASPQANPAPGGAELPVLSGIVQVVLAKWLADAGLAVSFDPLTSPFDANGTGFDRVLVQSTVNAGTGTVTIVNNPGSPTVTQQTTFAVSVGTNSVTVTTTTSAGSSTSSSVVTVVVPGASAVQAALADAAATLNAFAATVNAKGAALTATDLSSFFDAAYLEGGENATLGAARWAGDLRGATINSITIDRILSYDDAAKVIAVSGVASFSQGGVTGTGRIDDKGGPLILRQSAGGAWLLYGDQHAGEGGLQVEYRTDAGPNGTVGPRPALNAGVRAPSGTLTGVTLSGGGIFSNTAIPKFPFVEVVTYHPTPATTTQVLRDAFITLIDLNAYPPPGTAFTFTLTPVTGSPTTFTIRTAATTTDPVVLTSPSGTTLADAILGRPLPVTWSLPRTFPIAEVGLGGQVHTAVSGSGGFECNLQGLVNVSATTGTITLPTTCNGQAVVEAVVNVQVKGLNGELTGVHHSFR